MPNLHPISCGCRACRGPVHLTGPRGVETRWLPRHTFALLAVIAVALAALFAFFGWSPAQ